MHGISIGRGHRGPIVRRSATAQSVVAPLDAGNTNAALVLNSLTDFEEFFAPVYPMVRDLSWLMDRAEFSFDDDKEPAFQAELIGEHRQCRYFGPGFLERWARYLVDDWCDIIGMRGTVADPQAMMDAFAGPGPSARILSMPTVPDLAFECIDGVRWTIYAGDERLLAIVRDHVASRADLVVRDVVLGEGN